MKVPRTLAVSMLVGLVAVGAGAATPNKPKPRLAPLKVTSTLDGKKVLPHRIRWIAKPNLPRSSIPYVSFLIDGRVAWIERDAPYVFDEDDGPHLGYLVTSWLTPGLHRFTAKAFALDGRTASDTVLARVLPATEPPAALAGRWQRTIADTSQAPSAGTAGNPTDTHTPPGTYTMVLDHRFLQVRFPGTFQRPESDDTGAGWILDTDYVPGPSSFDVLGGVSFEPFHDQAEGGAWCRNDGPAATYDWSVTGDELTLRPVGTDACGIRAFVFAGTWQRAG